jgi:PAS domain S-box-containing protein
MNLGVWDWDVQTHQTSLGRAACLTSTVFPMITAIRYQDWKQLVLPEDQTRVDAALKRTLKTKGQGELEFRIRSGDGEIRHLYAAQRVIFDEAARPATVVGVNLDITERKQAEEELKKLSLAVEQSPASVVITDPQGTINMSTPSFVRSPAIRAEEAIGCKTRGILKSGETPPEVYAELWQTISAGDEWRGELINRKKNGELYWEAVSISAIKVRGRRHHSLSGDQGRYHRAKADGGRHPGKRSTFSRLFRTCPGRHGDHFAEPKATSKSTSIAANAGLYADRAAQHDLDRLTHPDDLDADLEAYERHAGR